MKNFISSIYIKPNTVSDEKICVGLFVGSGDKSYFAWSENKLRIINKLVSGDVYSLLSKSFINLSNDILKTSELVTPDVVHITNKYTANYFSYLNKYNKGLIEFKDPKIIPEPVNEKDFGDLYKFYVGESLAVKNIKNKDTLYMQVKKYLQKPAFKERTNVFYKVPETVISTIYRPFKVDFIGCNGSIMAGNSIDFTGNPHTIESKLYEYRALIEGLNDFSNKRNLRGKGKYFAYFNEPVEKEQKKIFENANKDNTKFFEFKEIGAITEAADILENSPYRKFSDMLV